MGTTLNFDQLLTAVWETVFMTFVSLFFASVFGLMIGILLYCTQSGGLFQNRIVNRITDVIVNVLRAIPFLILLILLIPLTRALVGSMLGAKAALPPLIAASTPF
jgi:D-methionine transport system permease protein